MIELHNKNSLEVFYKIINKYHDKNIGYKSRVDKALEVLNDMTLKGFIAVSKAKDILQGSDSNE